MGYEIYTIGREFGSLGKQVGEALAQKLGIKLYDKELLQEAAKNSGFCEDIFENHDEKPTNSFLYSLVMDTYSSGGYSTAPFLDMPLNHKVFLAQFDSIKKIAESESCVIVGRCADYALENNPDCISIFVRADLEDKIKRISKRLDVSENKAKDLIYKKDKQRASYYNYYTSKKWGDARSYDLCINTSQISIDDAAELIISYRELYNKNRQ
ncbi:MAG: cytidylate kinase-like family protein [Agathobacter sp.]|nr:cytidylate kinase-like family protein [Agathobacter sp.]